MPAHDLGATSSFCSVGVPLRFQAGFVDITPTRPIPLAGYAGRGDSFDGIADRLEANAAVVSDGREAVVIVSFDLLYVGSLLRHRLEEALRPQLSAEHLFLSASHTHFAPAADPTLPKLGAVDTAYIDMVVDRVATLVRSLLRADRVPLETGSAEGRGPGTINRRRPGWRISRRLPFLKKGVFMEPNSRGARDDSVRVVRLGNQAVLWSCACHPVFGPKRNHVSADFVGRVRAALRQRFGPDLAVLFWQGFSGDLFPSFASALFQPAVGWRRFRAQNPGPVLFSVWDRWTNQLADIVLATVEKTSLVPAIGPLRAERAAISVRDLLGPEAADKSLTAHYLCIGRAIQALGVSAEMVLAYAGLFREGFHNTDLFCVGCTDGVFGYVPTSQMVREGGYEAGEFLPLFSLGGCFRPGVEKIVQGRLLPPLLSAAA
jgi:hypothetical protein